MQHVIVDKRAYFVCNRTIAKQIVNNVIINYIEISINKK